MTGEFRSSFNHLSAIHCHFLVQTVLSALGNLKLVTAASQQVNKGEVFMSYLEKEMTALLPREDQNPSYKCFSFTIFLEMRQLSTLLPTQSTVFYFTACWSSSVLLPCACLSWALTQRQYQLAAFLIGTLDPYPVSAWKIVISWKKTATQHFSQLVWSSLPISTTERSRDFTRIECRQWVLPPCHRKEHFECQGWGMYSET